MAEVPYTFEARKAGQSKLNIFQQIDYLKHIYSLMKRRGELFRMVKFALVGLSGVGVNIGILYWLTESAGLFYLASATIAIEVSIISNFSLNNYFTFADRRGLLPPAGQVQPGEPARPGHQHGGAGAAYRVVWRILPYFPAVRHSGGHNLELPGRYMVDMEIAGQHSVFAGEAYNTLSLCRDCRKATSGEGIE